MGAAITLILDVALDTMFAPLLAVPIVIFFAAVWYLYPPVAAQQTPPQTKLATGIPGHLEALHAVGAGWATPRPRSSRTVG